MSGVDTFSFAIGAASGAISALVVVMLWVRFPAGRSAPSQEPIATVGPDEVRGALKGGKRS
mgnify:CR=1 FL=1